MTDVVTITMLLSKSRTRPGAAVDRVPFAALACLSILATSTASAEAASPSTAPVLKDLVMVDALRTRS